MTLEQAQEVLTLEAEGITAVRDALGEEFVQAVDLIMACPSRLVISGIGKSGWWVRKFPPPSIQPAPRHFFSIRWRLCMGIWAWLVPLILFWQFRTLVKHLS